AERRARLYAGDLFVYPPSPSSRRLVEFADEMVRAAFAPLDPQLAQFELPVARYAQTLAALKPAFIHHAECKRLLPALLAELGCDPGRTYFDVPRLRSVTSGGYLTTGIAYDFHPHRDTWYSAPFCQLNWWIPVYPLTGDSCMAFHPQYWSRPLRNSSSDYNYQEWNRVARYQAAQQIGADARVQPRALEPVQTAPDIRLLPAVGGVLVFSGAQLHSTVPNTAGRTRFSIDFRTVHLDDVVGQRGAPNIDSYCTGSTMQDYLRCSDLAHLPVEATAPYQGGPPQPVVAGT
ncbi:MAG TPA: hypothetical protein VKQ31_03515, partial [Steroidobacteraceae bacterium]|nr:hypothetical protein [Steroidobacteraceae bacterium]